MHYKNYVPLLSFKLELKFSNSLNLTIQSLAKIDKAFKNLYPEHANLNIPEYQSGLKMIFGAGSGGMGPIEFISNDKKNRVTIFSNGIIFTYQRYSKWGIIKQEILEILDKIKSISKIGNILSVRMEYIDQIKFNSTDFNIQQSFRLNFTLPEKWGYDLSDFIIGIKHKNDPDENPSTKWITRLRSGGVKDDLIFVRIENLYVCDLIIDYEERSNLEVHLDKIHNKIKDFFDETLGEKAKIEVGAVNDE